MSIPSFCAQISKKKRKVLYKSKQNGEYDKADLVLYEEVTRMPPFKRKTLVLVGVQGVGRRTLKTRIMNSDPSKFGSVIPRKSATCPILPYFSTCILSLTDIHFFIDRYFSSATLARRERQKLLFYGSRRDGGGN